MWCNRHRRAMMSLNWVARRSVHQHWVRLLAAAPLHPMHLDVSTPTHQKGLGSVGGALAELPTLRQAFHVFGAWRLKDIVDLAHEAELLQACHTLANRMATYPCLELASASPND